MLLEVGDGPAEALRQRDPGREAEALAGARDVEALGWLVSQTKRPAKPVSRAMVVASSRMLISSPLPRLTGSLES
jgi:hypothetical protein